MATPSEKGKYRNRKYHSLVCYISVKLRVLYSLKLTNWYRVGQQLSFDELILERLNNDYKGDKEECKKRMFSYWLHCYNEPSYECLMQALVNAGETVAAENLHKKSGQFSVVTLVLIRLNHVHLYHWGLSLAHRPDSIL